jgi:3-methyl-2-oxobutanoate hydroxymethyltransferase
MHHYIIAAKVGHVIQEALGEYRDDVKEGRFPNENFSPYKIPEEEADIFLEALEKRDALARAAAVGPVRTAKVDDTETIKVYG